MSATSNSYPPNSYPPNGSDFEAYHKNRRHTPSPLRRENRDFERIPPDANPLRKLDQKTYFDPLGQREKEWKCEDLSKRASKYFRTLPHLEPVCCSLDGEDFSSILKEIFAIGFSGVCIGEYHNQGAPKRLLIENMALLQDLGVSILFLEHIKSDLFQDKLDAWFNEPFADLPKDIALFLEDLDARYGLSEPYTYTNLVLQAKRADIRVVGIDTSESAIAGNPSNMALPSHISKTQRVKAMNFEAQKTIREQSQGCRYIVLTGVDHGSTLRTSKEIPGISELVQCPFLIIANASDLDPAKVIHNPSSPYQLGYLNEPGTVHAFISVEASISSPRRNTI